MKTIHFIAMSVLFACSNGDTTPEDDDTSNDRTYPWDSRFDATAEAFIDELEELGAPGVSIAILEKGTLTFSQGFGLRHPDGTGGEPNGETLYRIGSVTKMMSAVSLLQQMDRTGTASTEVLQTLMPELTFALAPNRTSNVQLHHLLTHQGGFYDWTPIAGASDAAFMDTFIQTTFAENERFISPAGAFHNYSNPNFMMAGYAAQVLDGMRYYPEIMTEDIFVPLDMTRTFFEASKVLEDGNYASGATIDWTGATTDSRIAGPDSYDHAAMRPAGFAWSSVEQLAYFADFLMEGNSTILSETSRASMLGPQVDTQVYPDFQHYGYGVFLNRGFSGINGYYETPVWQHGGAIYGYSAQLFILPDHDFAIAVLANTDGAYFNRSLAVAVESLVADLPQPTAFPDAQIDASTFSKYVGTYVDPTNVGTLNIGLSDGVLTVDAPTLEQYGYRVGTNLNPTSKDNFQLFINDVPYLITFIDREDGTPSYYLRNRVFVAMREVQQGAGDTKPFDMEAFEHALNRPVAPTTLGLP